MIDDPAVLIQVDATIIVGALIFLTIGPASTGEENQKREQTLTLVGTNVTILFLSISVGILLFGAANLLYASKISTFIGVVALLAPVVGKIVIPIYYTVKSKGNRGLDGSL